MYALLEIVELAGFGRRHDQRPGFGTDDMVGRDDAGAGIARHVLAAHIVQNLIAVAKIQDEPLVRTLAEGIAKRAGAANDRCHVWNTCNLARQSAAREFGVSFFTEVLFRKRNEFDHALVGLARMIAESENSVLVEDQPLDRGIFLEHFSGFFSQRKARHDVRDEAEPVAEDLRTPCLAVGLIDQAQHCGGVSMIDEFVRHECVQQRLYRWIWRLRIDQTGALHAHQFLVGHSVARKQLPQGSEPHRWHSGRLDACHVPSRTLDAENLGLFAEQIIDPCLYRRVAAAMKDEFRFTAEQACRIDTQRQFGADPGFCPMIESRLGVAIDPGGFHRAASPCRPAGACPTSHAWVSPIPPRSCWKSPDSAVKRRTMLPVHLRRRMEPAPGWSSVGATAPVRLRRGRSFPMRVEQGGLRLAAAAANRPV